MAKTIIYDFTKSKFTSYMREERESSIIERLILKKLINSTEGNLIISQSYKTIIYGISIEGISSSIQDISNYNNFINLIQESINFAIK